MGTILVIVPPSVIENWMNEFNASGHFGVIAFTGPSRDIAFGRIRTGLDEIMVFGRSMLQSDDDLSEIKHIRWKLIVIDEGGSIIQEFQNKAIRWIEIAEGML